MSWILRDPSVLRHLMLHPPLFPSLPLSSKPPVITTGSSDWLYKMSTWGRTCHICPSVSGLSNPITSSSSLLFVCFMTEYFVYCWMKTCSWVYSRIIPCLGYHQTIWMLLQIPACPLPVQLCANATAEDVPRPWDHVFKCETWKLDLSSSGYCEIWAVNNQMEDLSLSLSFPLCIPDFQVKWKKSLKKIKQKTCS